MKKFMIISVLVLSIAGISTAQADQGWRGQHNQNNQSDHRGDNHGNDHNNRNDSNHHDNGKRYDNGNRHDNVKHYSNNRGNHYGWNGQRYNAPHRYVRPLGYQVRTWRGGDRLPRAYRASQYHVDYRQYHLNAPPRGYQYVRVNNDVVLTAIATGIIASVITGLYY